MWVVRPSPDVVVSASDECFIPAFLSAFIARWPAFLCERFPISVPSVTNASVPQVCERPGDLVHGLRLGDIQVAANNSEGRLSNVQHHSAHVSSGPRCRLTVERGNVEHVFLIACAHHNVLAIVLI